MGKKTNSMDVFNELLPRRGAFVTLPENPPRRISPVEICVLRRLPPGEYLVFRMARKILTTGEGVLVVGCVPKMIDLRFTDTATLIFWPPCKL
jgi:hypothetical protein